MCRKKKIFPSILSNFFSLLIKAGIELNTVLAFCSSRDFNFSESFLTIKLKIIISNCCRDFPSAVSSFHVLLFSQSWERKKLYP